MRSVDVEARSESPVDARAVGMGGEYPSAQNKTTSTTSEAKAQGKRPQRHGRLGEKDFCCSFCKDKEHRSGDCPARLGKLFAQGARGLLRIAGEDFVRSRTTEIVEAAKEKQAAKRRPHQRAGQQQRTAGRVAKPRGEIGEIGDKGAGDATAAQTAAGKQQEEQSKKAAAEQQEEERRAAAKRKEGRKEKRKQKRREIRKMKTTQHKR